MHIWYLPCGSVAHLGLEAQHGHEVKHENETDDITFYDVTSHDVIYDITSDDIMEQRAAVIMSWSSIGDVTGTNLS